MELGEPVAVSPPLTTPEGEIIEFEAELVEVTFQSNLLASHRLVTIKGPHWQAGQEGEIADDWASDAKKLKLAAEPYSKRAAVYLVKGHRYAKHDVEVKVKVTKSKNVSGDARLAGHLNGVLVEGTCPTSVGEHSVAAKLSEVPETIQGYRGRMGWGLELSAGFCVAIGASLTELYFVLGRPQNGFCDGVWAEALRFLVGRVGVTSEKQPAAVTARITEYCHGRHGLRYDTKEGESHYRVPADGSRIYLWGYLLRESEACNCYDQAAAVQSLSSAVGVFSIYVYMEPFGLIQPTHLVGVGRCNNPYFGQNEGRMLVDAADFDRTGFSNHAFLMYPREKVADACVGPHLGDGTAEQYLRGIDARLQLYEGLRYKNLLEQIVPMRPGVRSDISPTTGIFGV